MRGKVINPSCKLTGQNGKVFNLIGILSDTLKQHDLTMALEQFHLDLKKIQDNGCRL